MSTLPPPFRLMAIVAITAPAHVRLLSRPFVALSFTYEQQRQSAFERTPILGSVDTHDTTTPHFHAHFHRRISVSAPKKRDYRCNRHRHRQRQPRCLHPRVRGRLGWVWWGLKGRTDEFSDIFHGAGDPYIENGGSAEACEAAYEPYDHPEAEG